MAYEVRIRKKVARGLSKLPKSVRQLLFLLVIVIEVYCVGSREKTPY